MRTFDDGIKVVTGVVGKCDQCDVVIQAKDRAIEATFEVGVSILSVPFRKILCLRCGHELYKTLEKRLKEAQRRW